MESSRRHAMHLLTLAGNARNHTAQAEESLAALEREAERLNAEMGQARNEQEKLGVESGQARQRYESAAEALKRLEAEIAALREGLQTQARRRECAARACQPTARRTGGGGGKARFAGVADSQPWLLDRHGAAAAEAGRAGRGQAPVGTLADFIEVSGTHEGVVDEFLREELNYVVVESWGVAEEGVRLLKTSDGRATFLVHSDAQGELFDAGLRRGQRARDHSAQGCD